ncbi:MAG: DUF2442 domain-containing protein [Rhodoferax sp.]|nr:DUF2442 domain-containing protein [Rhodoferax sp.]
MLLDVVKVQPQADYRLLLEFENGERRVFDMTPLLVQKPWLRIQPSHLFTRAFVENGTVAWPGNIDIAPETLYDLSIPVQQ